MSPDPAASSPPLNRALENVRLLRELKAKIPLYGEETPDAIFRRWQRLRSPALTLAPQPYEPLWPVWFAEERERLRAALGGRPVIEHFGSTSIPGLGSKRVIDLAVALEEVEGSGEALAGLGYEPYGNSPVDTETDWYWYTGRACVFVAHVCRQGRPWLRRALDFRDFLRAHPEERERYTALKERLAAESGGDALRFSLGKIELFHEIFTRAAAWREGANTADTAAKDLS